MMVISISSEIIKHLSVVKEFRKSAKEMKIIFK